MAEHQWLMYHNKKYLKNLSKQELVQLVEFYNSNLPSIFLKIKKNIKEVELEKLLNMSYNFTKEDSLDLLIRKETLKRSLELIDSLIELALEAKKID